MADRSRLRNALDKFLREFDFGTIVSNLLKIVRETDELEFVELLSNILDIIISYTKDDPTLNKLFKDVKDRKHQIGAALLSSLGSSVVGGVTGNILGSLLAKPTMLLNAQIRPALLDPGSMIKLLNLGQWQRPYLNTQMAFHGFADNYINDIVNVSKQRLDAPQFIQLLRRFPQHSGELEKLIRNRGWDEVDLSWLPALSQQFPTVQDWILFAVREATNEQRAKELGLDLGDFGIAEAEAKKSGLADGYFKYYWRAHWQLPPLTLGYEFLHRFRHDNTSLKFTERDLGSLITALDYSPIWHERMMAASYNPITRVDVRRVLKAGKLTRDGVRDAYYKDGYSDGDAELLTDWTMWEAQSSLRDLSLARVEEAIEKGIMTELEGQAALEDLRYDPEDIPRYMALWRYDREKKRIDAEVDYLAAQYMNNEIDEQNLRSQLTQLGLTPNNVYIAITNLNTKRKRAITPLSVSEIYSMWTENIITSDEALNELVARGVNKINAQRQMKLNILKKQKQTDKEVEDAQDKLEKENSKAITSDKAIAIAEVNVTISELQAEAVDLKVAATDIADIDTLTAMEQRQLAIKQELAYLALEKSTITLKFAKELKTQTNA